jgi:hypothetical protein
MRSLKLIAPLLLLSGCNLFRSGLIPQTCEDLPGSCGTIDTEPGDDTGDTAPWVPDDPRTLGVAVVSSSDAEVRIQAWDASGELLQSATLDPSEAPSPGPVAYDPDQPRLLLWDNEAQVLIIAADGSEPVRVAVDSTVTDGPGWIHDSILIDSVLYLVSDTAVWGHSPGDSAVQQLGSYSALAEVHSVFPAFEDNLFLLNWSNDGTPDLYRYTISTAESRLSYEDYDDSFGRSASGFQGPADKPHVCSDVGGVYVVETLQSGERAPAAFPSQTELSELIGAQMLEGVTDCAWDEGAELFMLHSAEHGVFAMDAWGRLERSHQAEAGHRLLRGSFFQAPVP